MRSCDVVPPFDEAMQTTPAIESAVRRYSGPTQPSTTKIRQVKSSVAIVIPEIGLDDEPITPVIRELTVTNRNPNKHDHPAADQPAGELGGNQVRGGDRQHQSERADQNQRHGQVALGAGHAAARRPALPERRSRRLPVTEATISGRALIMLRMPPAATAPAPM